MKYTFYQKLSQTKFVDFMDTNNFAFLLSFCISHIMVKKLNFRFKFIDIFVLNNFV